MKVTYTFEVTGSFTEDEEWMPSTKLDQVKADAARRAAGWKVYLKKDHNSQEERFLGNGKVRLTEVTLTMEEA